MKRKSSLRRTGWPMPSPDAASDIGFPPPVKFPVPPSAHLPRCGEDRLHDVVVAGTAANVAFKLVAHRLFVEIRLAADHVHRGHDHARRAETALKTMMLAEGGLHRVQLAVLRQALDGDDVCALRLCGEHGAGLNGAAVHMYDAGTALAGVAAHMRAGKPE